MALNTKPQSKQAAYLLVTIFLTLGLSLSLQSLLAAWTAPTANPPTDNLDRPLTEGTTNQTKIGGLTLKGAFVADDDDNTLVIDAANNRVGIGTANPKAKLVIEDKGMKTLQVQEQCNTPMEGKSCSNLIIHGDLIDGDGTWNEEGVRFAGWSGGPQGPDFRGSNYHVTAPVGGSSYINIRAGVLDGSGGLSSTGFIHIQSDGNIGIGTINPYTNVHIKGGNSGAPSTTFIPTYDKLLVENNDHSIINIVAPSDKIKGITFSDPNYRNRANVNYNGNLQALTFGTNGIWRMVIKNDTGNIGIGKQDPQEKLDVNGNVRATAFLNSSDRRLKQNIQPIQGKEALNKIKQLQGVEFEWKDNSQKSLGLIAQDVEKVFPELVHTDNAGLKTLEYGNLIAPLIEAIKAQQAQIEKQEQTIATQQKEIEELKDIIKKINNE